MIWIIAAVILIGVLVLLLRLGRQPDRVRLASLEDLHSHARTFVLYLQPGALMLIDEPEGPRFLQFARTPDGVLFGFPDAPWSTEYVVALEARLAGEGIACHSRAGEATEASRFIEVPIGGDSEQQIAGMTRLALIAGEVLGLTDTGVELNVRTVGNVDRDAWAADNRDGLERMSREGNAPARWLARRQLSRLPRRPE